MIPTPYVGLEMVWLDKKGVSHTIVRVSSLSGLWEAAAVCLLSASGGVNLSQAPGNSSLCPVAVAARPPSPLSRVY